LFTGLIADLGEIVAITHGADGARLSVATRLAGELEPGASVAVDGVCLTATALSPEGFQAEVINETLRLSSLAEAAVGRQVNLELATRLGERLGGHIVQGHVDGVGTVSEVLADGFSRVLTVRPPAPLERYIALKGSVAVNGVSLTVAGIGERSFTVSLIPETLERTNLRALKPGAIVNLEVDVVARYVERLMSGGGGR